MRIKLIIGVLVYSALASSAYGWDHGGHMTIASIAYSEIERKRPDLIKKIGTLLLAHPDKAPFAVAAGESKGKERVRRMFLECSRWSDDARYTPYDRPLWHTARWPLLAKNATDEAKAAAKARGDKPRGQAIDALTLNFATLANPEAKAPERAIALCWTIHLIGDVHQPLHVTDLFSKEYPMGNYAGAMSYVADPMRDSTMPLHMLWDSNTLRTTEFEEVEQHAREYVSKISRASLPELKMHGKPDAFLEWAQESYKIAKDFAYGYGIETVSDPNNKEMDTAKLLKGIILWVNEGISPVEKAPKVPEKYWGELQTITKQRVTLAGYRLADLIISAADNISAQTKAPRVL